jgi:sortase (surface protein transpeptidase)
VVQPTKSGLSSSNAFSHLEDFEKGDYIIVIDLDQTLVYSQPVAASVAKN